MGLGICEVTAGSAAIHSGSMRGLRCAVVYIKHADSDMRIGREVEQWER